MASPVFALVVGGFVLVGTSALAMATLRRLPAAAVIAGALGLVAMGCISPMHAPSFAAGFVPIAVATVLALGVCGTLRLMGAVPNPDPATTGRGAAPDPLAGWEMLALAVVAMIAAAPFAWVGPYGAAPLATLDRSVALAVGMAVLLAVATVRAETRLGVIAAAALIATFALPMVVRSSIVMQGQSALLVGAWPLLLAVVALGGLAAVRHMRGADRRAPRIVRLAVALVGPPTLVVATLVVLVQNSEKWRVALHPDLRVAMTPWAQALWSEDRQLLDDQWRRFRPRVEMSGERLWRRAPELIADADPAIRYAMLDLAGTFRKSDAIPRDALVGLLDDPEARIREQAFCDLLKDSAMTADQALGVIARAKEPYWLIGAVRSSDHQDLAGEIARRVLLEPALATSSQECIDILRGQRRAAVDAGRTPPLELFASELCQARRFDLLRRVLVSDRELPVTAEIQAALEAGLANDDPAVVASAAELIRVLVTADRMPRSAQQAADAALKRVGR